MFRIKDPKVSLDFYSRVLGMSLLKSLDFQDSKFSLYFLGYEENDVNQGDHSQARFQRTDQWKPIYTWLETLEDTEVVKSNDISDWLSANPDVRDDLYSRHSRYHLMHYIKKCHVKILKRKERKKGLPFTNKANTEIMSKSEGLPITNLRNWPDRQVPLTDEIDTKVDKATSDLKNTNVRLKDTFNQTYQLAEDLGKAFSELETFRSFVEVEKNVSARDLKAYVEKVYALTDLC